MDAKKTILLFLFLSFTGHVLSLPRFFNHVSSSSNAPAPAPVVSSIAGVPNAAPAKSPSSEAAVNVESKTITLESSSESNVLPLGLDQVLSQVGVANVDPTLLKICGVTDDPALCANSILPTIKAGPVDPVNVLETEIEACTNETTKVVAYIDTIVNDPKYSSPMARDALDACKETYSDIRDSLKDAKKAVDGHDVGTLSTMLSAVITDIGTCDDGFVEMEIPSPFELFDVRTKLDKLAGICLSMAKLVN
ncbi:pectinesterase inhibitor-like [Quillaja saponaria]|uniref:Pectinesterase inhibitor-like n=1 Tax=Quillaja saponaria TaxID=32244 RepID=A0AAD7Q1C7_QUISA|nr:pectinesterase inhibitor-like [Quillaja saponaria]